MKLYHVGFDKIEIPELLRDFDVIAGPVANDTIYDTWGQPDGFYGRIRFRERKQKTQVTVLSSC